MTAHFGVPLTFGHQASPSREQQQEVADCVLTEIKSLHAALRGAGHTAARRSTETTGAQVPGRSR